MDKGLDMALAHLKRAGSKLNPEHSDQQDDDGVDKKKKKKKRCQPRLELVAIYP